ARDLRPWINSYWIVSWDLPLGLVHRQTNISHASIKAAFEPEGMFLYGVPARTIVRDISGKGSAFSVMFRPGGFFPFWGSSLSQLTGKRIALDKAFGAPAALWACRMEAARSNRERAAITDAFWRKLRQTTHPGISSGEPPVATTLAEQIIYDRSIVTVSAAAAATGMDVRSLQRLFRHEVGITPKELILRFRLQEAAERLSKDPDVPCCEIALDLGYFDQAHFNRDFKALVGASPDAYRRRQKAIRKHRL
ncbi:MAG TPA: helix-turn-helix domain-containing protein, partial [Spirochaetia bacterium]|nr:helix-turn-helix domain-containing protein [Spirochaetia bacterium]